MCAYMLSVVTKRSDEDWVRGLGVIKVCNLRYDHVGGARSFFVLKVSTVEHGLYDIIPS